MPDFLLLSWANRRKEHFQIVFKLSRKFVENLVSHRFREMQVFIYKSQEYLRNPRNFYLGCFPKITFFFNRNGRITYFSSKFYFPISYTDLSLFSTNKFKNNEYFSVNSKRENFLYFSQGFKRTRKFSIFSPGF